MMNAPKGRREAAFLFILITVALDMLALGVMIPVLPKLIAEFEGGDLRAAAAVTGVFGFAWALMQFLFQPVLGALSDRYGRRPVILLSNLGLGLDYVFMALAPSLAFLFIGRLISGITAASISTANAYISDITPPEKRAGRFGMIGAAFGVGFILGPAIGGVLGDYGLRLPFWAAAALSLANALYGYFILPESLTPEKRTAKVVWRSANVLGSLGFLREPARAGADRWSAVSLISARMSRCPPSSCSTRSIAISGTPPRPAGRWRLSACRRPSCQARWCGRPWRGSARRRRSSSR